MPESIAPVKTEESRSLQLRTIGQLLHGLTVGGAEMLAMRIAQQMRSQYRFVFFCLDELGPLGEQLRSEGFPVWLLGRRPGFDWRCIDRLGRLLRQEQVELLHAHQYTPFFYGAAARLARHRIPVLFTEHGRWFPDYRRPKRVIANRLLLRRCDRVIGVGEGVRRALIENEGIREHRVGVIYNGVDVDRFATTSETHAREKLRERLGFGPDNLVLLQVARLDPLKDHLTAVRTVARLVGQLPNVRLVLVGSGPEEERIRAEIERLGVQQQVQMLGLRNDIPQLLAGSDILLLTSVSEGVPLTLIEGMAAGLPVVATDVGGVPEVVEDGQTGLLARAGDDESLAAAVSSLANNATLRQEMGSRGCRRALELFSEDAMHASYDRLYQEMLGAHAKG